MRRSVFLAVWLGLLLSPLKAVSSSENEAALQPIEMVFSEPEGSGADTPTSSPATPTSTPPDNSTVNETIPMPTSRPSDNSTVNETTPEPTETPTSRPSVLVDFCHGDPCGRNLATCISLNSNFTCQCIYGFYYSNKNCYRGKVFPANIQVRAPYSDDLKNITSTEYEELVHNVLDFFQNAFKELNTYVETVVMEIEPQRQSRSDGPLNVTVTNLFTLNSAENETSVRAAVEKAIDNTTYVSSYGEADPCDIYRCDNKTTDCQGGKEGTVPECICKPDFEKTVWDDRSCSACSEKCSAESNKYCVKEAEVPTCKCMPNYRNKTGECVPCSVGYSGEDCLDNTELILIIVGTVLGAIILSLVIAVSIISVRAKRKQNPEKRNLIKPGYSDTNTSDERPSMFPRVQTTSGHANPGYQPNNPYETRSTNRDRFPERDYDDLYEISREPRGFRTQSRY